MKMQDSFRKTMQLAHETGQETLPFLQRVHKLGGEGAAAIRKAMFTGSDDVEALVVKHMGRQGMADLRSYRAAMDKMLVMAQEVNPDLKGVKNYFPRWIKHHDVLRNYLGKEHSGRIDKIIRDTEKRLKRPKGGLTSEEVSDVYNKYLQGHYDAKKVKSTPTAVQKRLIDDLPDDIVQKAYADPTEATYNYLKQMSTDIHRKKMFGKAINKKYGDNLTDSIGAFAEKHAVAGDDLEELKMLMETLYVQGRKSPSYLVRKFKDIGYASMLGNPISALTQLGDVFLAANRVGTLNAADGIVKHLTGKGLRPQDFGLMDDMLAELATDMGGTRNFLEKMLKYSGFKSIDQMGKATLMNGALKNMEKLSRTATGRRKLAKKWRPAFGDDWDRVKMEIMRSDKGGPITSDMKSMVFAELADVQPITMMEMPRLYLDNPNGRVAYMLRTFTLKYLNLLRKETRRAITKGESKKGLIGMVGLVAAFNAGGITSDSLKDFVLNRESTMGEKVADNLVKTTGIFSRYSGERILTGSRPVTEFTQSLMPPVGYMDPYARAMFQVINPNAELQRETVADIIKTLPFMGRIYENYAMGGLEEYRRNQ